MRGPRTEEKIIVGGRSLLERATNWRPKGNTIGGVVVEHRLHNAEVVGHLCGSEFRRAMCVCAQAAWYLPCTTNQWTIGQSLNSVRSWKKKFVSAGLDSVFLTGTQASFSGWHALSRPYINNPTESVFQQQDMRVLDRKEELKLTLVRCAAYQRRRKGGIAKRTLLAGT